jgi:cytochrome P450
MHNPEIYHDPEEFIPERFIAKPGYEPETDPTSFAFGYGRRLAIYLHWLSLH